MPLVYERSERDGYVEIMVKPAWYVARYATLPFALPIIVAGANLGVPALLVCAAGLLASLGVRLFGFWAPRNELRDAMRRGVLTASGSHWDYRQPLRYSYLRALPSATVIKDGSH